MKTNRTWRRTVEEETGKVGKTWQEVGETGDASWKHNAPEGVKGNESVSH
jgi:hypothetical protein